MDSDLFDLPVEQFHFIYRLLPMLVSAKYNFVFQAFLQLSVNWKQSLFQTVGQLETICLHLRMYE